MADAVSDLYPKPPQPPQNALLSDPAKAVGLISALQEYRLRNEQFGALSQQPQAALAGQNISNQTSQMQQDDAATKIVAGYLSSLPDNASRDDVMRMKMAIRATHPNISAEIINRVSDLGLADPNGLPQGINTWRLMGLSPETRVSRVEGPPSPTGARTAQPLTTAVRAGAQEVSLPPGEEPLMVTPAARAERLQSTASTSPQYHADLENLRQLSKTLEIGGPTVEAEKKLNQLGSRFGLSITMSPDQLKSAEEFDKIANQISLNQSQMFHGSDAGLHTVIGANPSSSMSRYGREGVIDMLQGNQDAIDTARKAWLRARGSGQVKAQDFDVFMERIGQEIDPRVFQFNRMNRANQQKFLDTMDKADLADFEEKYKRAIDRKWVKSLKSDGGQQ